MMRQTDSRRSERGSAAMAVIVLLVLIILSGAGYWVWQRNHKDTNSKSSSGSGTSQSSSTSGSAAAPSVCDPKNLSLSKGSSEGTAGTIYTHAVVTNNGSATCTLTGYAAAFLTGGDGSVLGGGAAANSLNTPTAVSLSHGGTAHVVLGFPEPGNFDSGACSTSSANLQLWLPGAVAALSTAWQAQSCPGFSVTAIQPGS